MGNEPNFCIECENEIIGKGKFCKDCLSKEEFPEQYEQNEKE